jgi:hypothetical protein
VFFPHWIIASKKVGDWFYFSLSPGTSVESKANSNCLFNESTIHEIIILFCSHITSEVDQHWSLPSGFIN